MVRPLNHNICTCQSLGELARLRSANPRKCRSALVAILNSTRTRRPYHPAQAHGECTQELQATGHTKVELGPEHYDKASFGGKTCGPHARRQRVDDRRFRGLAKLLKVVSAVGIEPTTY